MLLHWFPLSEFSVYIRLAPPEAYEETQILQERRIFYSQRVTPLAKYTNSDSHTHTDTHSC